MNDEGGVEGGDCEFIRPKSPRAPFGVTAPDVGVDLDFGRDNASDAALRRRLVVPRAFVDPDRAEHTMATLFESR